ncbi:ATP-binding domain-containing protein [Sodiomyces alkalinus F11]|uniref:Cytoplasmic tRNA 2-thiolation protein 1 n=1 Tax=Sodiomyces alkalinus (strain CBS 110278 / VKM F-3762 / F11) TaxID=1314773 RepID=A0A3N2Q982_SODAK|nr:ATP-binding domain-containing protein [Sodiomyces alkalinus F11]ROT43341.1 ATP-binding domain-containing protein [Sodiomyces alkalinus F11]
MAPSICAGCKSARAVIKRPKNHHKLCKACFIAVFEDEVHHTIVSSRLFTRGERVAIGASGGKDSTVLASVLKTLNARHDYGVELTLLSIDEGIKGYRDDSLETVKRNAAQYDLPLTVLGYDRLYGWTMDQVVDAIGKKGNCTYCGVFRRQALDRGAKMLGIKHLVTGHNADDMAETILMNLLRGDLPRLSRSTRIVTGDDSSEVKRSKPLKYSYEKEIVLYAHYKKLDYFSTECVYSPEAFRGTARTLIKNLERVRPSAILDVVRSGEDMGRLVPGIAPTGSCACSSTDALEEEVENSGCGPKTGLAGGRLAGLEIRHKEHTTGNGNTMEADLTARISDHQGTKENSISKTATTVSGGQKLGRCQSCGYMSSQTFCQACLLVESLNRNKRGTQI